MCACTLGRFSSVWFFATSWTIALQACLSKEFSRQEYWSGCHFLLQSIFPAQRSNLGLLHCRQIFYHLSHQGMVKKQPYSWRISYIFLWHVILAWGGRDRCPMTVSSMSSPSLSPTPISPHIKYKIKGVILCSTLWSSVETSLLRQPALLQRIFSESKFLTGREHGSKLKWNWTIIILVAESVSCTAIGIYSCDLYIIEWMWVA